MTYLRHAFVWLNDPLNWQGPGGVLALLGQHLWITAWAVGLACLVAWPLGLLLGHSGRGGGFVVTVSNVTLAIPTLGLLFIFALTGLGIGEPPAIAALAIFAVPPLLANAYTGIREVDPDARDAAYGMGLSSWQVLGRVELPLAVPYLAAGFRTAAVQVVATASLAAFVGAGGLGEIIYSGFGLTIAAGAGQIIAGGILVAGLALLVEVAFGLVERALTPAPLRQRRSIRRSGAMSANV